MAYTPYVSRRDGGDTLKVVSGGTVDLSSGGALIQAYETVSSGALATVGMSIISSTATSENVYTLGAPAVGAVKYIVCTTVTIATGSSTGAAIVTSSGASATFGGTNTSILFSTGSVNAQCVALIGESTASWAVMSFTSTAITFSAT